jgi:hypothetical protein
MGWALGQARPARVSDPYLSCVPMKVEQWAGLTLSA